MKPCIIWSPFLVCWTIIAGYCWTIVEKHNFVLLNHTEACCFLASRGVKSIISGHSPQSRYWLVRLVTSLAGAWGNSVGQRRASCCSIQVRCVALAHSILALSTRDHTKSCSTHPEGLETAIFIALEDHPTVGIGGACINVHVNLSTWSRCYAVAVGWGMYSWVGGS